jgi:hypothetical protein
MSDNNTENYAVNQSMMMTMMEGKDCGGHSACEIS